MIERRDSSTIGMQPQTERGGRLNHQTRTAPEFSFQGVEELFLTVSLPRRASWNEDFPAKLGSCACFVNSLGIAAESFRRKAQ